MVSLRYDRRKFLHGLGCRVRIGLAFDEQSRRVGLIFRHRLVWQIRFVPAHSDLAGGDLSCDVDKRMLSEAADMVAERQD